MESADGILLVISKQILKSGVELRGTRIITGPENCVLFTRSRSLLVSHLNSCHCYSVGIFLFFPGRLLAKVTNIRLVPNLLYIMNHYLPFSPV